MKNIVISLIISMLTNSLVSIGQESDSMQQIGITVISQVNQGNSYITFPTDIGNIEPLWFEGNLIPNFYIRESKNSRLIGLLTPQIIIRMYQEKSYPVRTPSYMPQISIYYLLKEDVISNKISLFGRFCHHSNGQDGEFYLENGEINLKTGDFSTNNIELGLISTKLNSLLNAYKFLKTSIEIRPERWSSDKLKGQYSNFRWHNALSIFKLPSKRERQLRENANLSIRGETTWMFGKLNNWNGLSFNRLSLSFTFYYHPKILEDIGLFLQFYHGSDYYNIYFSHRLNVIRFGLMTNKLRF